MSDQIRTGLSEAEMLRAVLANDAAYDGRFFYGITTTMIFCFPSCPSKRPRPEHVRLFPHRREALAQGFRPCKRCLSDRDGGRAAHEAELVAQVQRLAAAECERVDVEGLAATVGLSPHYLMRIFRKVTGHSLHAHISRQRAERAAALLREGQSILDAAASVGFESTSAFYSAFTRTLGMPPGEYRQRTATEVAGR